MYKYTWNSNNSLFSNLSYLGMSRAPFLLTGEIWITILLCVKEIRYIISKSTVLPGCGTVLVSMKSVP